MRFFGLTEKGAIISDDYTMQEILQNKHIEDFRQDMKLAKIPYLRIYDEKLNYIKTL